VLKEVAPQVSRVAVVLNLDQPPNVAMWHAIEAAASSIGVRPIPADVQGPTEIEHAIETFAREPNGGLIVLPSVIAVVHRELGGGYLKITNTGKEVDRLIGGSLPVATSVEVHQMSMSDGVMKMRKMDRGLEIKPGQTVELKPGGYHLMFNGLREGLKEGQTIRGTLEFEKAGSIEVEFQVAPIGAKGPQTGGHMHMQHQAVKGRSVGPKVRSETGRLVSDTLSPTRSIS
jgi:copper(I)-binding protein